MIFEHFLVHEHNRIEAYIRRFARLFNVSFSFIDDLRQEAHLASFRALRFWKPPEGICPKKEPDRFFGYAAGRMSAFNWCAGPMRTAMEKALRRQAGLRPCSRGFIPSDIELREDIGDGAVVPDLDTRIDLAKAVAADPYPAQTLRLVQTAVLNASGVDLAEPLGISHQAISLSVVQSKKRLRVALAAYDRIAV